MMRAFLERFDFRVSLAYFTTASLWIIGSDSAAAFVFGGNVTKLAAAGMVKGLAFVLVTTAALFAVLNAELRKRDKVERALQNDITERVKINEALRRSEGHFTTIFHKSPIPIAITRLEDAHLIDVNTAYSDLFGYSYNELIHHTALELGMWVYPEQRVNAIEAIFKTENVRALEVHGRTKSGAILHLLAWAELIDIGDTAHIVSMFYDMTEQRKLEEQIRYHAMLLANVSDAVISTDLEFNIRSWNPAAEAIYGWTADEVIGQPVDKFIQGDYLNSTLEAVLKQFQTEGVWRGEATQLRRDGSPVNILASTSYFTDGLGQRVGIVSVNRDITDRKKAQQELQETERQRMELEKQKELLQLKERFISVVSHEFRTPLAVIITSAELVHRYFDRLTPERRLKHLYEVVSQAEYMTALMDDVLLVNKARAGRLEFNPAPMDLVAFCESTLEHIQVVDNSKHTFVFNHAGYLSNILLDVKLLQHILVNLLSNAIKYSPNGGEVRLEINRDGAEIVLQVHDQGIGIPPDSLPKIGDPFYRGTNSGDIGGTGLGMAIVKESVDVHGGSIAIESQVNRGTTFTVRLPATDKTAY